MAEQLEIELMLKNMDEFKLAMDKVEKDLAKLQKTAEETKDSTEKLTKAKIKLLGSIQKHALIATSALAGVGAVAIKLGIDFNKSFAKVQTLIGTSTEKAEMFKAELLRISNDTGKPLKELSDGLYLTVSAFGESADNARQLEIATKTAVAGVSSTTEALDFLSAVTKGYGDTSATTMQKVADLGFQVLKDGQTSFPEMANSIGRVVPNASELGISMEELMAVFSTTTGVLGGASEVSTKFSAALVGMTKPSKELEEIYDELGVASGDALVKQEGFVGALNKIKGVADKNGKSIDKYFGSVQAGGMALALTGNLSDAFTEKLENMHNAMGAGDEAFEAFTTGTNALGFNMDRAGVQLQNFGIKIGEELLPKLNEGLQGVFSFIDGLANMDKETVALIVDIGEVLLVIGGMTTAVVTAQKAWLALTLATKKQTVATMAQVVAQKALNAVMAINPYGLALIAITAIVAGTIKLISWLDRSRKAWLAQNGLLAKINKEYSENADSTRKLASEVENLANKENKTNEEKERLAKKIKELQTLIPDLSDEILNEAIAQGTLNQTVEAYINLQQKRAEIDAINTGVNKFKGFDWGEFDSDSGEKFLERLRYFTEQLEPLSKELQDAFLKAVLYDKTSEKELKALQERAYQERLKMIEDAKGDKELERIAREKGSKIAQMTTRSTIASLTIGVNDALDSANLRGGIFAKFWNHLTGGYEKSEIEMRDALFLDFSGIKDQMLEELEELERIAENAPTAELPDLVSNEKAKKGLSLTFKELKDILEEETKDLDDLLYDTEKEIKRLSEAFKGLTFESVDVGDDPWGMQKVLDLTGELGTEIYNQVKRVADSIGKSGKLLKKEIEKDALKEALDQRKEWLKDLGKGDDAKKIEEVNKAYAESLRKGTEAVGDAVKATTDEIISNLGTSAEKLSKEAQDNVKKTNEQIENDIKEASRKLGALSAQLLGAFATSANQIFGDLSSNEAKKVLDQLDALQRDLEDKMEEFHLNREAEEERIREEKRQREYEQAIQDHDRLISNLQHQFDSETSVKKRAELAEQLEEANKRKAEEKRRREEEKAEKERQRLEKMQLFEMELERHAIEVDRVNKENQMAEQDKKQRMGQVLIDTATGIATAWALQGSNLATMWFPAVFTGLMTGVASAQTAVIYGGSSLCRDTYSELL
jgi:TP901 family phage tail tape measure protein